MNHAMDNNPSKPAPPRINEPFRHRIPPEHMLPAAFCKYDDLTMRGEWKKAAEFCQELANQPDSALELWQMIAFCRMYAEEYEQAEAAARYAIEREPGYGEAWYMLGCIQQNMNALEEAVDSLSRSISLIPQNPLPWHELAIVYELMGNYEAALNALKQSIAVGKNPNRFQRYLDYLQKLVRGEKP